MQIELKALFCTLFSCAQFLASPPRADALRFFVKTRQRGRNYCSLYALNPQSHSPSDVKRCRDVARQILLNENERLKPFSAGVSVGVFGSA